MRRIYHKNIVFKTKFMATLALSTSVFVFATSAYAADITNPFGTTITGDMDGTADADNMTNEGAVTGRVYGDDDDDIIVNETTGLVGTHLYGGDGDDTITNYGQVGDSIYGYGDNDTIINFGTVSVNINGDSWVGNVGHDTITNYGTVVGIIQGIYGDDVITNWGTVSKIYGQDDNDTITNEATGIVTTLDGGDGNDIISNAGTVNYRIYGQDGNDTIINETSGLVKEYIFGQEGDDTIYNYGTVTISIHGHEGEDIIINEASGAIGLSIHAGDDSDTITNYGTISSYIYGQDGDDIIVNYGIVSNVDGDDNWTVGVTGNDTITNYGTVGGNIYGRDGNDIITNSNSVVGSIYGENGDDVITTSGTVGINISGGSGTDVLYLSDSASVGGEVRYFETVNVTGAGTKTVGTLNLTSTTSTIIEAYSPGTIISVTGSADLGASNALTVDFVGGGQAGKYYLIDTADSLTGTFTGITTSNLSDTLKVIYEYTSGDLIAKVLLESYQDGAGGTPALSETAQQISSVLDGVAPTATGDMETIIDTLNAASGSEQELANRIEQLSPEMHSFSSQITGSASGTLTSFSQMRMASIRDGAVANTKIASKYSFDPNDPSSWPKIAYSGDDFNSLFNHSKDCFGFFMQTMVQKSRQDAYDNNLGYTSTSWYTAGGMDYEFTDDFLAGISLGYARTKAKFTDQGNSLSTADNYQFGVYGSYHPEGGLFIDGTSSIDVVKNSSERRLPAFGVAYADYDGWAGSVKATVGYDFGDEDKNAWMLTPLVAVEYSHQSTEGYTETGSVASMSVDARNNDSLKTGLGFNLGKEYQSLEGLSMSAFFKTMYFHELEDEASISSYFVANPGSSFTTKGASIGADFLRFETGLTSQLNEAAYLSFNYNTELSRHFNSHAATIKINFSL
jgi:outer membrane autotransporter protein